MISEAPSTVPGGPPTLAAHPPDALAEGVRLGEFEVRGTLGAGGFGIVYLAWDHALEREVALKEYMPAALAGRTANLRVTLRAASHGDTFSLGLRSFVNEARLLARFDHPALVKVYRFWEANGTAYMAMPMVHGPTLRQVRQQLPAGSPGEAWCRGLLQPLLGALEVLHGEGVYHRDIAPDNIVLVAPGTPVLLDFGAARRVIGDHTHALTAILKPHFAPIEQYADVASLRQGPWTDLYGLAATFYYLLTGQAPVPAAARALQDELPPLAQLRPAACSPRFLAALDWAMAVRPQQRPQNVASWREALEGKLPGSRPGPVWRGFTVPGGAQGTPSQPRPGLGAEPQEPQEAPDDGGAAGSVHPRRRAWIGAAAGLAVLSLAAVVAWRLPPSARVGPLVPVAAAPSVPAARAPVQALARPVVVLASPAPSAMAGPPPGPPAVQASSVAMPEPTPREPAPPAARERPKVRVHHARAPAVPGPGERCADRMFLTRLVCMKRACDSDPRLRRHPECVQMQKAEDERRERLMLR